MRRFIFGHDAHKYQREVRLVGCPDSQHFNNSCYCPSRTKYKTSMKMIFNYRIVWYGSGYYKKFYWTKLHRRQYLCDFYF